MKLIVATSNTHKLAELRQMLGGLCELVGLEDIGWTDEIEETATTMEGNAIIKAKMVAAATELNCVADDSGLEVDALDGRPGVYSARYAGIPSDAVRNMQKVLDEIGPSENRSARFRSVIALAIDGAIHCFHGTVEGRIGHEPAGNKGFGYDPIFVPEGDDRTFAQMSAEEKDALSHRAEATKKLKVFLDDYLKCKSRVSQEAQKRD